ncbi:MAG: hypothetical protein PVI30_10220 [Myxococcales bacterium]|jgi:hypothetical protein
MGKLRTLSIPMLCALVLLSLGSSADAQRGRRVRRGAASPARAQEDPVSEDDGDPDAGEAGDDSGQGEPSEAAASDGTQAQAPPEADAQTPDPRQAEVEALEKELAAVMDALVQARARVSMLGKALFETRVRVMVRDLAIPDQTATRLVIALDGAPVYRGDGTSLPADPAHPVYEGFVAPGEHALTLELEHRGRDDERFRYTLRDTYHFEALREHRTDLLLVIDDDSDMAEDFEDDREGEYEVDSRLEVRAVPSGER